MNFIPIQSPFFILRILGSVLTIALLAAGCASNDNASAVGSVPGSVPASASASASVSDAIRVDTKWRDGTVDVAALRSRKSPNAATAASPLTAPGSAGASCGIPDFESSVLTRINLYRAKGANCHTAGQFAPAQPLVWNALLQQAATGHSQEMATKNYLSHTSLDGRTIFDRINATGYAWSSVAENIAASDSTVIAVVDGWMASDNHCANLMKAAFRDVGLTCVVSPASQYGKYWTLDLAAPR